MRVAHEAADPDATPRLPGARGGRGRARAVLLLLRRAAPGPESWAGTGTEPADPSPAFVLNLAAFVKPGSGFETDSYEAALRTVAHALRLQSARPGAAPPRLLLTNLDACLAGLGLDYDDESGRDVARCLATAAAGLLRGDADGAQRVLGAGGASAGSGASAGIGQVTE